MKKMIIIAGSLVVVGVVVYSSINLYSKLNKVEELNQRLEETADIKDKQDTKESAGQPVKQEGEKTGIEVSQTPEQEPSLKPEAEEQPTSAATTTPEQPAGNDKSTEDKAQKKQVIDAAITAEMQQLRASCQAFSSSLVQQIVQEISENEEAAVENFQSKYLTKVFAAESECDAEFSQLLSDAQSEYSAAGLNKEQLPNWSSQYENAKAQARADAVAAISNAMN